MAETRNNPWEDLIVSILSVNQYSIVKAYSHIEGLRREGIVDPEKLKSWTSEEIATRLIRAGFDRGFFMTELFGHRLASLGLLVTSEGVECCERILSGTDFRPIRALLMPVNGVGPKVLKNFYLMRGIQEE